MIEPELVASALHHPGECMFGGGSSDLVDTKFEALFDGRVYICREAATKIGVAAGLVHPQALAGVEEQRDTLAELNQTLTAELEQARALLEEAETLREMIAFTLERGVVVDQKTQRLGLRHKPGVKRIDVERSLRLEGERAAA